MTEMIYLPVDVAHQFMVDVLIAQGVSDEDARICADVLLASDLRGIESHGIGRFKYYYDHIQNGIQFPAAKMEIIKETETTVLIDGHHGMGHPTAYRAMKLAMQKARQYGVGAATVRNSTHFGIAGYYSLMAAQEGMMGFTVTNARPSITPTFGADPLLGTNPIAFAAPSDLEYPFCFDGATSITQRGKIEVLARAGEPTPAGWVINAEGETMTDPPQILAALLKGQAAFLPLGGAGEDFAGYKGYGLAMMVEILSASLNEGAFLKDLHGLAPDGSRRPYMLGHFFLAIDIEHFIPLEASKQITGRIMRAMHAAHKAPGQARIYVAGEKEFENEQRVRAEGIPINARLRQDLQTMRDALKVAGYEAYF